MAPIEGEHIKTIAQKAGRTTPGKSGISYEMIASLSDENLVKIGQLMSNELRWPKSSCLKETVIRMLHKGGEHTKISNYRPIALAECLGKILTRVMARRMQNIMEKNNKWSEAQAGFRPQKDTSLNISKLLATLARANKQPRWVTFLDIRKAYDSIPHWTISQSLRGLGFNEATITTIREIYTNNTTQVITPWGLTKKIHTNLGVRQGDPLSPILFNIVLDPVLKAMEEVEGGTILAFADDICIIAESREVMEKCLQTFQTESTKRNLIVNGSKSGFFVTNNCQEHLNLEVQGEQIPWLRESSYKYLGIMINQKMDPTDQDKKTG